MSEDKTERFEDVIGRLDTLVEKLESGGLSLEDALKVYEEGVTLARTGNHLLEGAERRIEELQKKLTDDGDSE
jgi:exodeoxyribonuclease VII small subunit